MRSRNGGCRWREEVGEGWVSGGEGSERQAALHRVTRGATGKGLDFGDEFVHVLELAVDGDVADVGDGVDLVELVHDLGADDGGGDLADVVFVKVGEDFFDGAVEAVHGDGALFAGFDEAAHELFAVEGLEGAVAFDDAEFGSFDVFVGGVAVGAVQALPAAAYGGPVLRRAGVEDFVFLGATLDATHG